MNQAHHKIKNFINFNKLCPICDKELNLYCVWDSGSLWESKKKKNSYLFTPLKNQSHNLSYKDFFIVDIKKNNVKINYNSSKLATQAKSKNICLFYLCNSLGIKDKDDQDYEIDLSEGCYYRSSEWYVYKKINDEWELSLNNESDVKLDNLDEILFYYKKEKDLEKQYTLRIDYQLNDMTLSYTTYTESQKKDESFIPNYLHLKIPIWDVFPNFSYKEKDKLISKFNSWILLY